MTAVLVVAGISAVAGLILGLYRLAWFTLVIPSLLIVIVAVVVLLYNDFGLLCNTSIDLCRDTSRILNTDAPRRVALVKNPLRSE
jgi:hypothetical protein